MKNTVLFIFSFAMILNGCLTLPRPSYDPSSIARASNGHVLYAYSDNTSVGSSLPLVIKREGSVVGKFIIGDIGDYSLYYVPIAEPARKLRVWHYRDYGGIDLITETTDHIYVYYNFGLIFWHYRVSEIDIHTARVKQRSLSKNDYDSLTDLITRKQKLDVQPIAAPDAN